MAHIKDLNIGWMDVWLTITKSAKVGNVTYAALY